MAVSGGIPILIERRRAHIRPDVFVGRADELAALSSTRPAVTLILGEPGGGKSRLLAEAARSSLSRVISVSCHSCVSPVPFEPLLAVCQALQQSGRAQRSPWERPTEAERLLVIRETFDRHVDASGMLVQIDDLQWADGPTIDAISYLADRLRNRPIRWHVAARSGEEPVERLGVRLAQLGAGSVLRLREFDPADFRTFVTTLCDRQLSDAKIDELRLLSGGNPLYAEQLIAAATDGDGAASSGMRLLLGDRIKALDAPLLKVANVVAVHVDGVAPRALAELANLTPDALSNAISELENRFVLKCDDDGIRFRHELLRRECYAQIPAGPRATLHRSMVGLTEDTWRRVRHLDGAGLKKEAAELLLRHGLSMIDRADRIEAGAALDGAVERSVDAPDVRLQADAGLAALSALSGATEIALEAMRRFERSAAAFEPPIRVDARCRFAEAIFEGADDCSLALPFVRRAISDATQSTPALLPRLLALAGAIADRSGSSKRAVTQLRRGLAACSPATPARDRIRLLSWLGVVHARLGAVDRGCRETEEAAQMASACGLSAEFAQCCLKCCYVSDLRGDRVAYELWCRRGLESGGAKLPRVAAILRLNLATVLKERGAIADALAIAEAAGEEARFASPALRAQVACSLALSYAMLGRFDDARRVVGEMAHVHASDRWRRAIEYVSGRVAELSGDAETALARYRGLSYADGEQSAVEAYHLRAWAGETRVLFDLNRYVELAEVRTREGTIPADRWRLTAGYVAEVEGYRLIAAGSADAGCARLREAAECSKERFRAASLRATAGLASANRDEINHAIAEFDDMGARAAAEDIRRRAHRIGFRPRSRPRAAGALTESEGRIAMLIGAGKTNSEIGSELGLSARTVEHYVSNMLSKLGLRSRAQIAATIGVDR